MEMLFSNFQDNEKCATYSRAVRRLWPSLTWNYVVTAESWFSVFWSKRFYQFAYSFRGNKLKPHTNNAKFYLTYCLLVQCFMPIKWIKIEFPCGSCARILYNFYLNEKLGFSIFSYIMMKCCLQLMPLNTMCVRARVHVRVCMCHFMSESFVTIIYENYQFRVQKP
jgi:hypothetical protein